MNRTRLVAAVLTAAAMLSGCAAQAAQPGTHTDRHPTQQPTPSPTPSARLVGPTRHHRLPRPVVVAAADGTITSVDLRGAGTTVPGHTVQHRQRWRSTGRLAPLTDYRAVVHLVGQDGKRTETTLRLRTGKAPRTLTMHATPGPGWTVGVGEPVVVTFNRPVPDRAAVQRHMSVTTSAGPVTGAWHWFSPTVAHYRPRHYWPAHSSVHVHVDLHDVYAGHGVWGDRNHDWSWRVGDAHVSYVNAKTDTFTVTDNGKVTHRWPTGLGMPGHQTRSGVYTVLATSPVVQMTSCSVGMACSPGSADYYNLTVHWDTRLTDTGTFVHAAPWDTHLGYANTSHGCIHLSTAHAQAFYRFSVPGDVVVVRRTGRPADLPADPGMMDWNMSWAAWLAGSATQH